MFQLRICYFKMTPALSIYVNTLWKLQLKLKFTDLGIFDENRFRNIRSFCSLPYYTSL